MRWLRLLVMFILSDNGFFEDFDIIVWGSFWFCLAIFASQF